MGFTATKVGEDVCGSQRRVYGTYVSDGGSTGGDIDTSLRRCTGMRLQPTGSAVQANAPSVSESFPDGGCDGSAVTIVTDANAAGTWEAYGY